MSTRLLGTALPFGGGGAILDFLSHGVLGNGVCSLQVPAKELWLLLLPFPLEFSVTVESREMTGGKEKPGDHNLCVASLEGVGKGLFHDN